MKNIFIACLLILSGCAKPSSSSGTPTRDQQCGSKSFYSIWINKADKTDSINNTKLVLNTQRQRIDVNTCLYTYEWIGDECSGGILIKSSYVSELCPAYEFKYLYEKNQEGLKICTKDTNECVFYE